MKAWIAGLAAFVLAGCASVGAGNSRSSPVPLDTLARDYVRLVLEIDAHESGYVDAYFGPESWREEALKNPRMLPELKAQADALVQALTWYAVVGGENTPRVRVLLADVASARFRLDMVDGKRVPFADEAERLFALRPVLKPLAAFDGALARIDALVPGTAPLSERVETFRSRYSIPDERVQLVMDAAIAECRKRTAAYIPLPPGESFSMELVKGQSWGAYNYYLGGN
ncbi:MAG: hypothetical protein ABMA14_25865, partial [Hyphomonadaceae bacterium]